MKTIAIISIALSFFCTGSDFGVSQFTQKKINKTLEKLWPEVNVNAASMFHQSDPELKIFKLMKDDFHLGYATLCSAPSKFDHFDMLIVYNPEIEILATNVLVYREDYGGEISSKRWLKQFEGRNEQSGYVLYNDIQGISGATISCRSATKAIETVTKSLGLILQNAHID